MDRALIWFRRLRDCGGILTILAILDCIMIKFKLVMDLLVEFCHLHRSDLEIPGEDPSA
jgi:hypothetical protein